MTLAEAVHARTLAQKHVENAVAIEFPVGTPVEFKGVRGPVKGHVSGTEGEIVLIRAGEAVTRRHFDKVVKS